MKLMMKKTVGGLKPMEDNDYYNRIKIDEIVEVDTKKKRNPQFHRKFFALLNIVFENQEAHEEFETFRAMFTIECGYYTTVNDPIRGMMYFPKSISFSSMDDLEFNKFYDKAVNTAIKVLGCTKEDLAIEVAQRF